VDPTTVQERHNMAANMISMKKLKPSPPIPGTKWHYFVLYYEMALLRLRGMDARTSRWD
jgi:hypothetical protein